MPEQPKLSFQAQQIPGSKDGKLDFAVRYILDELGIEAEEPEVDELDAVLEKYGKTFPSMADFSALARSTLKGVSPLDDPDAVIVQWMEREELLFRRLERHIIDERIRKGLTRVLVPLARCYAVSAD